MSIELLVNRGAETGAPDPWVFSGLATVATVPSVVPFEGDWCFRLQKQGSFFNIQTGSMAQAVALYVGERHDVSVRVESTNRGGSRLRCEVDPGDGVFVELGIDSQDTPGWRPWEVGSFEAIAPTGAVRFSTVTTGVNTPSGTWLLDNASLLAQVLEPEMAVSYPALDRLRALVDTISVANGYHTTLAGKVYGDFFLPGQTEVKPPYACIVPGVSQLTQLGLQGEQDMWDVELWAFLPRASQDPMTGSWNLMQSIGNCKNDIRAALLSDQRLGGTVRSLTVPDVDQGPGVEKGVRFGWVRFGLVLQLIYQPSTLLS